MLSRELQEEYQKLYGKIPVKDIMEKLRISYHEHIFLKKKFGYDNAPTYIRISDDKIKFIKDHMDMSTYSLSNLLDVSIHMVNKTKKQIKEGKI